jgi:ADP-dependent NAD(P)H-hydrate dehydratase / NAD(P)H-hydrate epimerase
VKVVNADEMRAIERAALARGITVNTLMQRAADAIVEAVRDASSGGSVLILAGPGNNGGDGVVSAAKVKDMGLPVTAYTFHRENTQPFTGDTVRAEDDEACELLRRKLQRADVIVDALLGIGQNRQPDADLRRILDVVYARKPDRSTCIAVDIPTGVNADSGAVPGAVFHADTTLCMGFAKRGTLAYPGAVYCGKVQVADIGLPPDSGENIRVTTPLPSDIAKLLPRRDPASNKGSSGRLEVVSGSRDFTGAPVMCSMAAYRVGAGLVEIALPASTHPVVAAHVLEPVFRPLPEEDGKVAAAAADVVKVGLEKAKACAAGPGLGLSQSTIAVIRRLLHLLAEARIPGVIDADGLNALSSIDGWWEVEVDLVLTPHPGEMSRLTGISIADIQQDRVRVALSHAAKWRKVVVLKGAGTVIASPEGDAVINSTGGPNLATAGTGDVLTGVIGGLLAQGLSPFDAAVCGVYLHGRAGDLLRDELGDVGTVAGDLIDTLPEARLSILQEAQEQQ